MIDRRRQIKKLANHFSQENLVQFFRAAHERFRPVEQSRPDFVDKEYFLASVYKVGEIELETDELFVIYRAVCQLVWNRVSKAKSV